MRSSMVYMRQVIVGVVAATVLMVSQLAADPVIISADRTISDSDLTSDFLSSGFTIIGGSTVTWSATKPLPVNAIIGVMNGTLNVTGILYTAEGIEVYDQGTLTIDSGKALIFTAAYNNGNGHGATLYKSGSAVITNNGVIAVPNGLLHYSGNDYPFDSFQALQGIGTVVPYLQDGNTIATSSGTFTPSECAKGFIVATGATVYINNDLTLASGATVTISAGATLAVSSGITFTTVVASSVYNYGTLGVSGTFASGGVLYNQPGGSELGNEGSIIFTNNAFCNYGIVINSGSIANNGANFQNNNNGIVYNSGTWTDSGTFYNNSGALFINTTSSAVLDRQNNTTNFNNNLGTIALAFGSKYVDPDCSGENITVAIDGFNTLSSRMGGNVVPYLTGDVTIGGAGSNDASLDDCVHGFIVAPGANVAVAKDLEITSGNIDIQAGGTLTVNAGKALNLAASNLSNSGSLVVHGSMSASGTCTIVNGQGATITNNSTMTLSNQVTFTNYQGVFAHSPTATLNAYANVYGTVAMAYGSALNGCVVVANNFNAYSGIINGNAKVIPYICDELLMLWGYNNSDLQKGFVVAPGGLAAVRSDLVVQEGGAVVIQQGGSLVIQTGCMLTVLSGATFINRGSIGNQDIFNYYNEDASYRGALALAIGATVIIGADGANGAVNEVATSGNFDAYNRAPGMNTNVVPYLLNGQNIGSSAECAVTVTDCARGFVVADAATVALSGSMSGQTGLVVIGDGATFKLLDKAYWQMSSNNIGVINRGTIVIKPGAFLYHYYNIIQNYGALVVEGSYSYALQSQLGGTLALAIDGQIGSATCSAAGDVNTILSQQAFPNLGQRLINIPGGKTIAATGGDFKPADVANGFFVAHGDTVTINDDVLVSSGQVVVQGNLVINEGKILSIASGVNFVKQGSGNITNNGTIAAEINTYFVVGGNSWWAGWNQFNNVRNQFVCGGTGVIIPRLVDGNTITRSGEGTFSEADIFYGFLVASGTGSMSGVNTTINGLVTIAKDAVLDIAGGSSLYIYEQTKVVNNGTISNNANLAPAGGTITNNGLIFSNSYFYNYQSSTITNNGSIAFAPGSLYQKLNSQSFMQLAAGDFADISTDLGCAAVPYLKNGFSIGDGDGYSVTRLDCANGFVVEDQAMVGVQKSFSVAHTGSVVVPSSATFYVEDYSRLFLPEGVLCNGASLTTISTIQPLEEGCAVLPFLTDGQTIGTDTGNINPDYCKYGFFVDKDATVTVAGDVANDNNSTSPVYFIVDTGATLTVKAALNTASATVINNGTIIIESPLASETIKLENTANLTNNGMIIVKAGSRIYENAGFYNQGVLAVEIGTKVIDSLVEKGSFGPSSYMGAVPYISRTKHVGADDSCAFTASDCANGFVLANDANIVLDQDVTVTSGKVVIPSGASFGGAGSLRLSSGVTLNGTSVPVDCAVVMQHGQPIALPYLTDQSVIGGMGVDPTTCTNGFVVAPAAKVYIQADVKVFVGGLVAVGTGGQLLVSEGSYTFTIENGADAQVQTGGMIDTSAGIFVSSKELKQTLGLLLNYETWLPSLKTQTINATGDGQNQEVLASQLTGGFEVATGATVTIDTDVETNQGTIVDISGNPGGAFTTLVINSGKTFTNSGYLNIEYGAQLLNNGTLENNGIIYNGRALVCADPSTFNNNTTGIVFMPSGFSWLAINEGATVNNNGAIALATGAHLVSNLDVDNSDGAQRDWFSTKTYTDWLGDTNVVPYIRSDDHINDEDRGAPWSSADCAKGFVTGADLLGGAIYIESDVTIGSAGIVYLPGNVNVYGSGNLIFDAGAIVNGTEQARAGIARFDENWFYQGTIIPYLTGTVSIGSDADEVKAADLTNGFFVAAGAVVTLDANFTLSKGVITVAPGGQLIIPNGMTLNNAAMLINNGNVTINTGGTFVNTTSGSITGDYGNWTNNGTVCIALQSFVYYDNATVSWFIDGSLSAIFGGKIVQSLPSGPISIGGQNATVDPAAVTDGMNIPVDTTVTVAGHSTILTGTVDVPSGSTFSIADGKIMAFGSDVVLNIEGDPGIMMEGDKSVLHLNGCTVNVKGKSVLGAVSQAVGDQGRAVAGTVIFEGNVTLNNMDEHGNVNTSDLTKAIEIGTKAKPVKIIYLNGARVVTQGCVKMWPKNN